MISWCPNINGILSKSETNHSLGVALDLFKLLHRLQRGGALKTLIIIPTYNEAMNLPRIISRIRKLHSSVSILIVDDSSPDGTGQLVSRLSELDPCLHLLSRPKKEGLAAAYFDGFTWAKAKNFETVVQMDADGSHEPKIIADILMTMTQGFSVVIGSRWVDGGETPGWSTTRRLLSKTLNASISIVLDLGVQDSTSGFRGYSMEFLDFALIEGVSARGFSFQVEMSQLAGLGGFSKKEIPISFREREAGKSKMSLGILIESAFTLASMVRRQITWKNSRN
jgi:dolichol-phosphate mannosyltransferase